jgi:hypothetical protein
VVEIQASTMDAANSKLSSVESMKRDTDGPEEVLLLARAIMGNRPERASWKTPGTEAGAGDWTRAAA